MHFKIPPINVPTDAPFSSDALNRKPLVEAATTFIDSLKGPFVLSVDSPWGTGKTTLLRLWSSHLESEGFSCLYFNAWETDFSADPLIAFVGELNELQRNGKLGSSSSARHLQHAKRVATVLAKRILPVAGKIATAGLLDFNEITEEAISDLAADGVKDAVDAYNVEKTLIAQFHDHLAQTVAGLRENGKKDPLVVFVDELDRCRPTFAVELLERIKHLFSVPNVIFVLAVDKSQLSVSLRAVYGNDLNTVEYLRRFFDLEISLPKPDTAAYTRSLFQRFGFEPFFAERNHPQIAGDWANVEAVFNTLSDAFDLSLRAREQCFTHLRVAMISTPTNRFLHPILLATLIILKLARPDVYKAFTSDDGPASHVIDVLRGAVGPDWSSSRVTSVIEANVIASTMGRGEEPSELQKHKSVASNAIEDQMARAWSSRIVEIIHTMGVRDQMPSLRYVVGKIELAWLFR